MDHAYAELNGIRLHYVTVGRGPLMLFVHGFPEFWYEWRRQLREFGRDHQAVAPDMRGYNLSDKPAELSQYRVPHMVEDLRALADHLGRERRSSTMCGTRYRSEEHTSELQSRRELVCRLLLEKKKNNTDTQ